MVSKSIRLNSLVAEFKRRVYQEEDFSEILAELHRRVPECLIEVEPVYFIKVWCAEAYHLPRCLFHAAAYVEVVYLNGSAVIMKDILSCRFVEPTRSLPWVFPQIALKKTIWEFLLEDPLENKLG